VARARSSARARTYATCALLVRRVGYGEADLIVTLFTEQLGRVSALARGARKSQRRFSGALEPMHTLRVRFDKRAGVELGTLTEANIERVRGRLTADLDRLDAAGRALGWLRRAAPPERPEPEAWAAIIELLDRLDSDAARDPRRELAAHGLAQLAAFGWGIDLVRCVGCGTACAPERTALVDPARGGLVCRSCGGARLKLSGAQRERLARAAGGDAAALERADLAVALEIVEAGLQAHMGFD
jgi:DNA repair protein RecO (recombination protein O)